MDALEKLNKKAVRYGAEPVTWTLGEPREEKVRTQDGREGNVMSWFSSGGADLEPGREYTIDATVKAHSAFQGVPETQLTRAKVKEGAQA